MKKPLLNATADEFADWLAGCRQPAYRAEQIRHWIFRRRADRFDVMENLPKVLRSTLAEQWQIFSSDVVRRSADEDGTQKLLLAFPNSASIETVLIPQKGRWTVCLSTQVGCGMGCVFCASGLDGVERNLTRGEMLEQLLRLQGLLPSAERISRIVVMGMGEPLANMEELLAALSIATSPKGLGISARNITISTVGLPAKIRQLAECKRPYHLAVSLHAPNDELRQRIVPMAEKIRLQDILAAADTYRRVSARQLTFEYVLLAGINDSPQCAKELVSLLGRRDAFVNLIPYNSVTGLGYVAPAPEVTEAFASTLRQAGFAVKIRKRKGSSIDAACGQLRRNQPRHVTEIRPLQQQPTGTRT